VVCVAHHIIAHPRTTEHTNNEILMTYLFDGALEGAEGGVLASLEGHCLAHTVHRRSIKLYIYMVTIRLVNVTYQLRMYHAM